MQLLELDNLHQVGYVPVDLGVYKKGDTVPLWVAPIEDVTFPSVDPALSTTSIFDEELVCLLQAADEAAQASKKGARSL